MYAVKSTSIYYNGNPLKYVDLTGNLVSGSYSIEMSICAKIWMDNYLGMNE